MTISSLLRYALSKPNNRRNLGRWQVPLCRQYPVVTKWSHRYFRWGPILFYYNPRIPSSWFNSWSEEQGRIGKP